MIDEEIRRLERELAEGNLPKAFELARVRGRAGLGPEFSQINFLDRKKLEEAELFDTEIIMPPLDGLFFCRNWEFGNGDRKIMGEHTNHLGAGNSLPVGFAMAVTGLRLLVTRRSDGWSLPDMLRVLEGQIRFAVGLHDEGREWPARDVANGIKLEGPLVLEELVLFEASWKPSRNDPILAASASRSAMTHVRFSLTGVMAKPPG